MGSPSKLTKPEKWLEGKTTVIHVSSIVLAFLEEWVKPGLTTLNPSPLYELSTVLMVL